MKPIKAFSVQAEEQGVIAFATNSATARREGANEMGVEWEDVESCTRAKWADQFAAQGWVPVKAMLDEGWWQSCSGCGRYVTTDREEDDDGNLLVPVIEDRKAWCCQSCKDDDEAAKVARKARAQELIDAVAAAWPEAVVYHASEHDTDRRVYFSFPGGTQQAIWTLGDDHVLIVKADEAAWIEYRAMYRARRELMP